ncbi:ferroxidase fet3 [Linderina macrospora]|uniref:Ferroxidase fet3 n=1 Tax=Linderina macrospora TaxID=4868 RepID=A0ACC1JCJ0_9FUNG|nr:ferroxidase fet3 [Linderina macrospora]
MDRVGSGIRRAIGVNRSAVIPPIVATVDDMLVINAKNSLDEGTSLHIHGYIYNGTSYFDGAQMVCGCSIAPKSTFTYEIPLKQAGTFWIHGHSNHHNVEGLRAPLVVQTPVGPYSGRKELLVAFEEWFAAPVAMRANATFAKLNPKATDFPDGIINGADARQAAKLQLIPGQEYRVRLVNMASAMWFDFAIDGHDMSVIEVDGILTEPAPVRSVRLAPAQRASVLIRAKPTAAWNYRYRAKMYTLPECANTRYYSGSVEYAATAPVFGGPSVSAPEFNDINLVPLIREPLIVPERSVRLEVGAGKFSNGLTMHYINNITYAIPKVPSLYTALTTGALARDPRVYGPQSNALVLRSFEKIELLMVNYGPLAHPMHLHGHAFQVVEYGFTNGTKTVERPRTPWPIRRDTVTLGPFQYVAIRFQADNPGMWILHCHNDRDHYGGMSMLVAEAPEMLQLTPDMPPSISNQCTRQGIKISGNAAGNDGLDMRGLPPAPALINRVSH